MGARRWWWLLIGAVGAGAVWWYVAVATGDCMIEVFRVPAREVAAGASALVVIRDAEIEVAPRHCGTVTVEITGTVGSVLWGEVEGEAVEIEVISQRDILPRRLPGDRPVVVTLDSDGDARAAGVLADGRVTWFGLGTEVPDTLNQWVRILEEVHSS